MAGALPPAPGSPRPARRPPTLAPVRPGTPRAAPPAPPPHRRRGEQEQRGERDEMEDEREDRVEGIAERHHADGAGYGAESGKDEQDLAHSPSVRRGVRSSDSASSISLVKMRSERW